MDSNAVVNSFGGFFLNGATQKNRFRVEEVNRQSKGIQLRDKRAMEKTSHSHGDNLLSMYIALEGTALKTDSLDFIWLARHGLFVLNCIVCVCVCVVGT